MVHAGRELMRAPIGTIHSFCERLLREHALEAGIDPNFRLLDEAEARTLQENALDATFAGVWTELRRQDEDLGTPAGGIPLHRVARRAAGDLWQSARAGDRRHRDPPAPGAEIDPAADAALCRAVDELLLAGWHENWQQAPRTRAAAYTELQRDHDGSAAGIHLGSLRTRAELLPRADAVRRAARGRRKRRAIAIKAAMARWLGASLDIMASGFLRAFLTLLQPVRSALSPRQR